MYLLGTTMLQSEFFFTKTADNVINIDIKYMLLNVECSQILSQISYFDIITLAGDCEAGFMRINDFTPCGKCVCAFNYVQN